MPFTKATKTKARLRLALIGPSGSGKTYSALAIAGGFGGKVALIDTEHGSASKYADLFDFDSQELESFAVETYIKAIDEAAAAGYDVLIIDSLSHAWSGKEGILEAVDRETLKSRSKNAFTTGWAKNTPRQNQLVEALVQAPMHLIVTMRTKMAYVLETTDGGKSEPRKVGLAPIQREGVEYEFDVVGDLTLDLDLHITKSRLPSLNGAVINKPGPALGVTLNAWLTEGADPVPLPTPGEEKWIALGWNAKAEHDAFRRKVTADSGALDDEGKRAFKEEWPALGFVWADPTPKGVADQVLTVLQSYQPETEPAPEPAGTLV